MHRIKAGRHADDRLLSSQIHLRARRMERRVVFHPDCRYTLPAYHAQNVNKLFGLSYGLLPHRTATGWDWPGHWNSARFGWFYDAVSDDIVLVAYCYINGRKNWNDQLVYPEVARIRILQPVGCLLERDSIGYFFRVYVPDTGIVLGSYLEPIINESIPSYGLTHSLYFGGAQPATQNMRVEITPLPSLFLPA